MGEVLRFFPRQTVATDSSGAVTMYSDVFEIADYSLIVAELRVYCVTGSITSINAKIEETMDPTLGKWSAATAFTSSALTLSDEGSIKGLHQNPLRFVRVVLTTTGTAGRSLTFAVEGVARTD